MIFVSFFFAHFVVCRLCRRPFCLFGYSDSRSSCVRRTDGQTVVSFVCLVCVVALFGTWWEPSFVCFPCYGTRGRMRYKEDCGVVTVRYGMRRGVPTAEEEEEIHQTSYSSTAISATFHVFGCLFVGGREGCILSFECSFY